MKQEDFEVAHDEAFKTSMLSLDAGDVLTCTRGGETLYSIVLERINDKSGTRFTFSALSASPTLRPYGAEVFWDEGFDLFCEVGGRIFLDSEEWVSTDTDGAQTLLAMPQFNNQGETLIKAKTIFNVLIDKRKDFRDLAREILKILTNEPPTQQSIDLLAYALSCASRRIWSL